MSYVPYVWSGETLISARNLRHADEQYEEAKNYLDAHAHDDLYFTTAEADAKFFHLDEGDTLPAGLDADTVDGQHATDLIGTALPTGVIMAWSGTDGDIPTGWAICNGGSGTPDLRDMFVAGAGNTYSIGTTGGVASVTPGAGSVDIATHALTLDEIPSHQHAYYDRAGYGSVAGNKTTADRDPTSTTSYDSEYTDYRGGDDPHGHGGSTITITSEGIDNRPPYYALYYIKKVI